ncbi:MAG: hypothetical protein PHH00_01220 [Candidatus Nanoarchaeia archaeon]|nr:hypothetical protein [Candidatus Nanoarchaeia archaeon]
MNKYDLSQTRGGLRRLTELDEAQRLRQSARVARASVASCSTEYNFVQEAYEHARIAEERAETLEARK